MTSRRKRSATESFGNMEHFTSVGNRPAPHWLAKQFGVTYVCRLHMYVGKALENLCKGDKRSATLIAAVSLAGSILDPFIIWNGVETHSGAHVRTASSSVQYQTSNHYISTGALLEFIHCILHPYYIQLRNEKKFVMKVPLILLIDCCSVHISSSTKEQIIHECREGGAFDWLRIVYVPARCTGKFQPCDVGVYDRLKQRLRYERSNVLLKYCRYCKIKGRTNWDKTLGNKISKEQLLESITLSYNHMRSPKQCAATPSAWEKCGITVETLEGRSNSTEAWTRRRELFPHLYEQDIAATQDETDISDEDWEAEVPNDLDTQSHLGFPAVKN